MTTYESQTDRLAFEQFQIQSNTLQANASGQIEKLSTAAECNLNGTLNYDLAQVSPLLRPYLGEGIQLVRPRASPVRPRRPTADASEHRNYNR